MAYFSHFVLTFVYNIVYKLNKILLLYPLTNYRFCARMSTLSYTNMPDDINQKEQKELIRVSISEAARLFGVNAQTIRRAIRSQEVTYVVVAGRYKLNFESLVKWSQRHTTVKNKLQKRGIGQYVDKWKIKNPLYSPNPKSVPQKTNEPGKTTTPGTNNEQTIKPATPQG